MDKKIRGVPNNITRGFWFGKGGVKEMANFGVLFLTAGVVLELLGIYLIYRGKSTSLEPIILGLLFFLVGFLAY